MRKQQMFQKLKAIVQEIEGVRFITKNKMYIGDINLNWGSNECGMCDWASENGLEQKIMRQKRKKKPAVPCARKLHKGWRGNDGLWNI